MIGLTNAAAESFMGCAPDPEGKMPMPGQDEATWGLTFSPLDKAQGLGGPSVRENDLEFVTSPGQDAKKVYCCSFLSFRFVEDNYYWYHGWHS